MFIDNRTKNADLAIDSFKLGQIAESILSDFLEQPVQCTLSFVKPSEIRKLNKQYRGVDEITDVLTFQSEGEIDPETNIPYLGDILICIERAFEQAEISGHSLENEVELLLIHGLLHLIGFDHDTPANKDLMWEKQTDYLNKFNIQLGRKPGDDFEF